MTNSLIEAAKRYQMAQAMVLHEAETFAQSGDSKALFIAVEEMCEARELYQTEKSKTMDPTIPQ